MSGHTPAPWAYRPNGSGWNNLSGADGRSLWCRSDAEHAANRALIAAAPEMYEALKYAVNCFDRESCDPMLTLDPVQAIARAKYALAKADSGAEVSQ